MFGNKSGVSGISFFHAFDFVNFANSADADPYVIVMDGFAGTPSSDSGTVEALNGGSSGPSGKVMSHIRYDLSGSYFGAIQAFDPCAENVSILSKSGGYSLSSSPYTTKDGTLPMLYGRIDTAVGGIKGQSSLFRWHLQNGRSDYFSFSHKTSPSSSSTEDRIVIGNISLPWDGSSVAV